MLNNLNSNDEIKKKEKQGWYLSDITGCQIQVMPFHLLLVPPSWQVGLCVTMVTSQVLPCCISRIFSATFFISDPPPPLFSFWYTLFCVQFSLVILIYIFSCPHGFFLAYLFAFFSILFHISFISWKRHIFYLSGKPLLLNWQMYTEFTGVSDVYI